ncbi:MAG: DNA polymerase III subunit delta' [Alphaproteobacteria bacterium]
MGNGARTRKNQAEAAQIGNEAHPGLTRNLLGQDHAITEFLESWNHKRPHHAWLLQGAQGIGKATLAFHIARFILHFGSNSVPEMGLGFTDQQTDALPNSLDIPEYSPLFDQLVKGAHNDFRYIAKLEDKTQINVDQIRELLHFTSLTAGSGGWRIIIIDSANDLTNAAANALLKLLEEPPKNTMLLLIAHQAGRLLPTIRSRCRNLVLEPLQNNVIMDILGDHYQASPPSDSGAVLPLAQGSAGRALKILRLDGALIYNSMLSMLGTPKSDNFNARKSLAIQMTGNMGKERFSLFGEMLSFWAMQSCKYKLSNDKKAFSFSPLEQAAYDHYFAPITAAEAFAQLERWQGLITKNKPPANLDPAQLIHVMFG